MNLELLKQELILDEAMKLKPYRCTAGALTIGVGRNLDDVGLTKEEALYLLDNDIRRVCEELDRRLPWWRTLSDARRRAVANMAFNLGTVRLLGFRKALTALEAGDYVKAADEFYNSRWSGQVGARATRLCNMIRDG